MKKYVLIAGVNGAGKSTLYQLLDSISDLPRINTDEIVREFGDWKNISDVTKAGKIAARKIKELFANESSFNQETTLCGNSIIRNIKHAKEKGYFVELHYVSVDSVEIAKERIAYRVAHGGHGIPDEDVERRYVESGQHLKEILNLCDMAIMYDNTESFRRFAVFENSVLVDCSDILPDWFKNLEID